MICEFGESDVKELLDNQVLYKLCDMWILLSEAMNLGVSPVLYKLCDMWIG